MKNKQDLRHRIRVAMGQEPADIVFKNANLVSTFTEEVISGDLAISRGKIVALGHVGKANSVIDLNGSYLCPSMIDAHIHVESSMLSPEGFAEAVVPHGTGTVISDPHEIVNVLGLDGLKYMLEASKELPLDILYGIPSCVPATHMETSGGEITAADIQKAFELNPKAPVLSEMMNFPGVFLGLDDVLDKICIAHELGLEIDGHAPMLKGKELNAYLNAHILTDHECATVDEAREKLRRGMYVLVREGSAARNLKDLVAVIDEHTVHRICIASDDRHPNDLVAKGHLDHSWRELIRFGIEPVRALRMLSLNAAQIYGLRDRGGLGVGYRADFFIADSLSEPKIKDVYHAGIKVAEQGRLITPIKRKQVDGVLSSVYLPENLAEKLNKFPRQGAVRAIGVVEGQLITAHLREQATDVLDGELAYLAVVERHGKNGQVGLGMVKGLGIKSGALASTVAHDHHNLILAGKSIEDMLVAAEKVKEMGGGFALVDGGQVKASVALPIGGIMSPESPKEVAESLAAMERAVKKMGVSLRSPFMTLSFLALSVIPHLKLTDMGLVDVDKFKLVPLAFSSLVVLK